MIPASGTKNLDTMYTQYFYSMISANAYINDSCDSAKSSNPSSSSECSSLSLISLAGDAAKEWNGSELSDAVCAGGEEISGSVAGGEKTFAFDVPICRVGGLDVSD